jgi:hypothetical protein
MQCLHLLQVTSGSFMQICATTTTAAAAAAAAAAVTTAAFNQLERYSKEREERERLYTTFPKMP